MIETGSTEVCGHQLTVMTESDLTAALRGWVRHLAGAPPGVEHLQAVRVIRHLYPTLDATNVGALRDVLLVSPHAGLQATGNLLDTHLMLRTLPTPAPSVSLYEVALQVVAMLSLLVAV